MRKIQNIAFVLLATLFASCINDHIEPTFCRDGELSISVSTRSAGTRVQGANDDIPTAESIVKDLQYFLYVKGSGVDAAPIYAGTITGITDNDDYDDNTGRPSESEDDNFSKTVQIPASALNQLFPGSATECEIYIIANYLDNTMDLEHLDGIDLTKDLANATRKNLKAIKLNTPFYETPSSFVMDSKGTDIVSRGTGNAINTLTSGTIYLTRAAAKVMIEVNVQNAIDVSGNTWEPITQITDPTARKMFISFYNGVTTGVIDDGTDESGSTAVATVTDKDAYYKVENVQLQSGKIGAGGATGDTSAVTRADESTSTSWVPALDFYSYANSWTAGDEDHEPYFEISIPWRKRAAGGQDDSANWVTYTYTVPIAMNDNRFDRNKLYLIRLNVGALGDLSTLESYEYSYVVLNWDEETVNATLTRPKYFVVEEDYVEVYNENSYSVDFSASDIVSAEIISIIKPDYSDRKPIEDNYIYGSETSTSGAATVNGSSLKADSKGRKGNENPFTVTVDNSTDDGDGKSITLTHTLNNDMESTGFDYIPYTVTVRATMTITDSAGNTSTMVKDITFKQYPEMYISADLNSDYDNDSDVNGNRGYAWVNNSYTTLGNLNGFSTGNSNSNPNMITITTTALKRSDFVIGDPRSIDINNLNYSRFVSAPSVQGNNRSLSYYYPTRSTDDAKSIISPKFRIASSYGLTSDISITNAQYRCASYQEDGYPAGRWRIPTAAEIEYIVTLSARGFITILFNDGGNYWAANGYIYKPNYGNGGSVTQTTGNSAFVRCVYDEWYWGSAPIADKTKFTWGDEPRQ